MYRQYAACLVKNGILHWMLHCVTNGQPTGLLPLTLLLPNVYADNVYCYEKASLWCLTEVTVQCWVYCH